MAEPVNPDNQFDNEAEGRQLAIAAYYKDPTNGALYLHRDLEIRAREPWADEEHIKPPSGTEAFGDVKSWAAFVKQHSAAPDFPPLLTWNSKGFRAVLDYHQGVENPGRAQWIATQPFEHSVEWKAWTQFADGHLKTQKDAVNGLGDLADDITTPPQAEIVGLLRSLRTTVNSTADTEFQPDGSTSVKWQKDARVKTGGEATLPSQIKIKIPILKGDPTPYGITVTMRPEIDADGHLHFRFNIPLKERALESAYAEQVTTATTELGADLPLLRAAG